MAYERLSVDDRIRRCEEDLDLFSILVSRRDTFAAGDWEQAQQEAYEIDSHGQILRLDLSARRRAEPQLHQDCAELIAAFGKELDLLLQRAQNCPETIREKLAWYRKNAGERLKSIRDMDVKKQQQDAEFGFPAQAAQRRVWQTLQP